MVRCELIIYRVRL